VTPRDVECEGFNLTYTRIASDRSQKTSSLPPSSHSLDTDVDQKVDDAIESFLRTLSQIGPELLSVSCMYCTWMYARNVMPRLNKHDETRGSLVIALCFLLTGLLDSQLFRKASNAPTLWARFTRREGRVSREGCSSFFYLEAYLFFCYPLQTTNVSPSPFSFLSCIVGSSGS
jgi:hypothetical protein